jgi:hypothetical protein
MDRLATRLSQVCRLSPIEIDIYCSILPPVVSPHYINCKGSSEMLMNGEQIRIFKDTSRIFQGSIPAFAL